MNKYIHWFLQVALFVAVVTLWGAVESIGYEWIEKLLYLGLTLSWCVLAVSLGDFYEKKLADK